MIYTHTERERDAISFKYKYVVLVQDKTVDYHDFLNTNLLFSCKTGYYHDDDRRERKEVTQVKARGKDRADRIS